jgi:TRAP-type mannitol/chloroaromatic compound transport system permease small subunit
VCGAVRADPAFGEKVMQKVLSLIDRITGCVGVIAAWLVVPLVLATAYEVFMRYTLNAPTMWAFEIGYMMMGSHFLLGAAYTLREGSHVRIDLLDGIVSPKITAAIRTAGYIFLLMPFLLWLSWSLWGYFDTAWVKNETSGHSAWNPVVWPYRLVFLISFVVLTLQVVGEIIKGLQMVLAKSAAVENA